MKDWFWFFRSKRCAVCGETRTAIELTIRFAGKKNVNKWFCTHRHLKEWWDIGKDERTKVITVKK